MLPKEIIVTIKDIEEFNQKRTDFHEAAYSFLRPTREKHNLYSFIEAKYTNNTGEAIRPVLKQELFKDQLYLDNANFEGCRFDNVKFSGEKISLKNASFSGAILDNCVFIDDINLAKVKFGPIEVKKEIFVKAMLAEAEFNRNEPNVYMYKPSLKQLEKYLEAYNNSNDPFKESFNDYLKLILKNRYPVDAKIIADFRELEIFSLRLNNIDLSGSDFSKVKFGGVNEGFIWKNVALRDCNFDYAEFEEVEFIDVDLRGSCLINTKGNLKIENAKFSLSDSFELSEIPEELNTGIMPYTLSKTEKGFIPENFSIKGKIELDPCYVKNSGDAEILPLIAPFVAEIDEYLKLCHSNIEEVTSFKNFMAIKRSISNDFIPDLSRLDLSGKDLSKTNFSKCNFAYANLKNANTEGANFEYSNFNGADLRGQTSQVIFGYKLFFWDKNKTNAKSANFNHCNISLAQFSDVNIENGELNNIIAKGANLTSSNLTGAKAHSSEFTEANLNNIEAQNLEAPKSDFTGTNLRSADFTGANLSQATLNADISDANLKGTNLEQVAINNATISGAKLNKDTKLENAIISNSKGEFECNDVDLEQAINTPTLEGLKTVQEKQKEQKHIKEFLGKYKILYLMFQKFLPASIQEALDKMLVNFIENKPLFLITSVISSICVSVMTSSFISMVAPQLVAATLISALTIPNIIGGIIIGSIGASYIVEAMKDNEREDTQLSTTKISENKNMQSGQQVQQNISQEQNVKTTSVPLSKQFKFFVESILENSGKPENNIER